MKRLHEIDRRNHATGVIRRTSKRQRRPPSERRQKAKKASSDNKTRCFQAEKKREH